MCYETGIGKGEKMNQICLLKNMIQEYAWGSRTLIPNLLGNTAPSEKPQAELWMGAHPKSPSLACYDGAWHPLDRLIQKYPVEILNEKVAGRYSSRLPYLFKILAAEKPLSIQAHPSRDQAAAGFERENLQKIPIDAGNRNYRDANHKPECICALSTYWALCGFRPIPEMQALFSKIQTPELDPIIEKLSDRVESNRIPLFFQNLITWSPAERASGLGKAVKKAEQYASQHPAFEWILRLHAEYGPDAGILSPVFLNLVCLQPGQALFLFSGELHAYLSGLGIELMANSDNVLRGGLTPKHVDVNELIKILRFEEKETDILKPVSVGICEKVYSTWAEEFVLSVITLENGLSYESGTDRSVEILFCTDGRPTFINLKNGRQTSISKGQSVMVPASIPRYRIEGEGILYKAGVPEVPEISSR
ncbi:MAG: mannose-6-phosphate isomerase, class I [Desulfobacteraceae bacterium]|nr:MAG: mannose-6-phosphate isomerase, class I [Desulfobacteraceae bacterium]